MICIECMKDKDEKEQGALFFDQLSDEPMFCLCILCQNNNVEYPSLKYIN